MTHSTSYQPEWLNDTISLNSKVDIVFWCKMLGCKEEHLVRAVLAIGNSARTVNTFLELNRLKEK